MANARARRAADLVPLVVGIALVAASGVIVVIAALSPPRYELMTTEQALLSERETALWLAWSTFGLATVGLALIAFWIGRRVGRRGH